MAGLSLCGCGFPEATFDRVPDASAAGDSSLDPDTDQPDTVESDTSVEDGHDGGADVVDAAGGDADAPSDVACSQGNKPCNGECVSIADPAWGCGPDTCTPCGAQHATAVCVGGACALGGCDDGWKDCNTTASDGCEADTETDTANCGTCGATCSFPHAAAVCSAGACARGACAAGFQDCDGLEVNGCEGDLLHDPAHCGTCTTVCTASPGTPVCNAGVCGVSNCPTGTGDCNNDPSDGCETDLSGAAANCGFCGNACVLANATPVCAGGACAIGSCATGFEDCDTAAGNGCETNTSTSTQHCGACGTKCPTPVNGAPTCASGACGYQCLGTFADCNDSIVDGCEVNVASDLANCGTCQFACSFPHAGATCASSQCVLGACTGTYRNCDTNPANGCETDTTSSLLHCGLCGQGCPTAPNSAPTCVGGACGLLCSDTWADCDGNAANGCEHVKPDYRATVLADGPVAYWRLGESTGAAVDASGHGLDLVYHATAARGAAGALYCSDDKAVGFTNAGEGWFGHAATLALEPKNAISIELWMLQAGTPTEYEKPLWYGDASVTPWGSWGIQRDGTAQNKFAFLINIGGTASWLVSGAFTKMDSWYHVVATYDGSFQRLYVNGALDLDTPLTGVIKYDNNGYGFAIGGCDLPTSFLTGSVDEVALYDKALSPQRIAAHYAAGVP